MTSTIAKSDSRLPLRHHSRVPRSRLKARLLGSGIFCCVSCRYLYLCESRNTVTMAGEDITHHLNASFSVFMPIIEQRGSTLANIGFKVAKLNSRRGPTTRVLGNLPETMQLELNLRSEAMAVKKRSLPSRRSETRRNVGADVAEELPLDARSLVYRQNTQ